MRARWTTLLLAALVATPSCASFRAAWTGAFNDDLAGESAPRLVGAAWIDAQGIDDTPRDLAVEANTVVAFFRPG